MAFQLPLPDLRVVITGGASGMGAASVRAFAHAGAKVVIFDIDEKLGRDVIAPCNADARVHFQHCDVADADSVTAAFAAATQWLRGLDVVIHCAGIAPFGSGVEIDVAGWDHVFAVNARGTFLVNQAAFAYLKDAGGRIINFASGAGVSGYPGKAHYAASKGAVLAWTRTIAQEWARYGITVNAIVPAIATPMYAKTRSAMSAEQLAAHDAQLAQRIPIGGKLGDPDQDLAPVLLFLASAGSRFITGQTIPVDGGLLMLS